MHLQPEEQHVKTFYHHPMPLVIRIFGFAIVSAPFYFFASFFSTLLTREQLGITYAVITTVFLLIAVYDTVLYYLDRLIITNQRVLHVDWKSIFDRAEHEAELIDIQDIGTQEAGILSFLPIFDYGLFKLETASTKTTISFTNAPDPEGIKHFIYHLNVKPHRIGAAGLSTIDDKARYSVDEEARITRRQ